MEKLYLPVVDITAVVASVIASVILIPLLIKNCMDLLKASLSMFGDFKLTSCLSMVSTFFYGPDLQNLISFRVHQGVSTVLCTLPW